LLTSQLVIKRRVQTRRVGQLVNELRARVTYRRHLLEHGHSDWIRTGWIGKEARNGR
jgi:hypothetical protein